jgi:hypothetical protein
MKIDLKNYTKLTKIEEKENEEDIISLQERNLRQTDTGLPMIIWFELKSIKRQHWYRIKVQQNYSQKLRKDLFVSMSISNNPKIEDGEWKLTNDDYELVKKFIKINLNTILKLFKDEIFDTDFYKLIKKV